MKSEVLPKRDVRLRAQTREERANVGGRCYVGPWRHSLVMVARQGGKARTGSGGREWARTYAERH